MNLNALANRFTSAVNSNVSATYQASIGETRDANFKPVPQYGAAIPVTVQIQPITGGDLLKLEGSLNAQKVNSKAYVNFQMYGVVRKAMKGGDLLTVGSEVYLIEKILEDWPNASWCCVALTLQTDVAV